MALMCGFRQLKSVQRPAVCAVAPWLSSRPQQRPLASSRALLSQELQDDHVKHWNAERLLSVGLLGVVPAAFVFPSPALEYALALSVVVHSHWGLDAILADYARPKWVGPILPKVMIGLNYFLSAFMLGGLFYFNYTDVGLTEAVKMLWKA